MEIGQAVVWGTLQAGKGIRALILTALPSTAGIAQHSCPKASHVIPLVPYPVPPTPTGSQGA